MAALADLFRRAEEVQRRVQREQRAIPPRRRPSVSERALALREFVVQEFRDAARKRERR